MFSCSQLILLMCAQKTTCRPTAANHGSLCSASRLRPLASVPTFAFHVLPPSPPPLLFMAPSTTTSTTTRNNNPALRLACQGTFGTSVPTATLPLPASLAAVPIVLETTWPHETGTANTTREGGAGGKNNNNKNENKIKTLGGNTFNFPE